MLRWCRIVTAIAISVIVLGGGSVALASASKVGPAPRLPSGARVLGSLPDATTVPLTVALQPSDPLGLRSYATAVSTPGSSVYHQYLTTAQFAQRFGPTPSAIAGVVASLRAHGLSPGTPSPNGLLIPVRGTAGELARAFAISFRRVALPDGRTTFANTSAPTLDANVAPNVQSVIGLDGLTVAHSGAARAGHPRAAASSNLPTGGPQPCAQASGHGNTADQIATAYSLPGFYTANDFGRGQMIAIFQLEPTADAEIATYQACYGTTTYYTKISVDGGPGASRSGESSLDLEAVIGLAPSANVRVYQGPNGTTGIIDTYNRIVSDNAAKVVTSSWGLCEPNGSDALLAAENTIFQEAAVQGQSVFAASGDRGSQDCWHSTGQSTVLAVEDPASQPFVTGVGGTRLNSLGPPPSESVWNNGPGHASGGGISRRWLMESYQSAAPRSLNVINGNSSGAPCGAPAGSYCREVPDISADADPHTGYAIYYAGAWHSFGGTSASAPTMAAITALINATRSCGGQPIGFASPVLYEAAANAYGTAFNDVTTGTNDVAADGVDPHLFRAGPLYDMATGLGTPISTGLAQLARLHPTVRFRITNTAHPGTGQPVQFDSCASSKPGGSIVTYQWNFGDGATAKGAKASHTYKKKGSYRVKLVVTDNAGKSGSISALIFVGKGSKIKKVLVQDQQVTVKVNGPGKLRIGAHHFNIKKSKGRKATVTIRRKDSKKSIRVNVKFTPKFGNLQTRKVKVKF